MDDVFLAFQTPEEHRSTEQQRCLRITLKEHLLGVLLYDGHLQKQITLLFHAFRLDIEKYRWKYFSILHW